MIHELTHWAIDSNTAFVGAGIIIWLIFMILMLGLIIVGIVAMWKMYAKAGKPGWAAIIPFYNMWVLAEIGGKPGWWGLAGFLAVIPVIGWIASLVVYIMIAIGVARNFGKSDAFGVIALFIFNLVGYLILGFGSATYHPVSGATATGPTMTSTPPMPTTPSTPQPPKMVQ